MEFIQIDKDSFMELLNMVKQMREHIMGKPILSNSIELLTVQELAISLGISESTIYRAIRKGVISKDENGKLHPIDINEAILKKRLKCESRYAEEFRRTFLYK